jgi:hypothetical protein
MAHSWGRFESMGVTIVWTQVTWELGDGKDEHTIALTYDDGEEFDDNKYTESYTFTGYRAFARASDKFGELVTNQVK